MEYINGVKERLKSPTYKCDYCDKEKPLHEMITHQYAGELPYVVACCVECMDHVVFEHSVLSVEQHLLKYIETLIEMVKQDNDCNHVLPEIK